MGTLCCRFAGDVLPPDPGLPGGGGDGGVAVCALLCARLAPRAAHQDAR